MPFSAITSRMRRKTKSGWLSLVNMHAPITLVNWG